MAAALRTIGGSTVRVTYTARQRADTRTLIRTIIDRFETDDHALAKAQTVNLPDGYRTRSLGEGTSTGPTILTVDDDGNPERIGATPTEAAALARTDRNDHATRALSLTWEASRHLERAAELADEAFRHLDHAAVTLGRADAHREKALPPPAEEPPDPDDVWCLSCSRPQPGQQLATTHNPRASLESLVKEFGKLLGTMMHDLGLCRWCAVWWEEHRELPPVELIDVRARTGRITSRDVEIVTAAVHRRGW
jgi:hypothetical protein